MSSKEATSAADAPRIENPAPAAYPAAAGAIDDDFDAALGHVRPIPRRRSPLSRIRAIFARAVTHGGSITRPRSASEGRRVGFDGFTDERFDEKIDRDRRYGTVYTVREEANAFVVRIELPRRVPHSRLGPGWGIIAGPPEYVCAIQVAGGALEVRGSVRDATMRRLCYVLPSFPADFMTRIELGTPLGEFCHRLRNQILEIVVFKALSDPERL